MKRMLALLIALLMLTGTALADPLPLGEGLFGTACWPEDAAPEDAAYVYRYSYPSFTGDEAADVINEFYAYTVDDALAFAVPINGESLDPDDVQATTDIVGTVTCNNDDFVSVLVVNETFMSASTSVIYSAQVFARKGAKAGTIVTLPYLLGLLEKGDTADEWLETRQTAKAEECVRRMVWEAIEEQMADGTIAYYDDLTYEDLSDFFYPEEDFYLDENGDPVFFIEECMAAPQTEGVLLFPITLEDLLDEL